MNEFIKKLELCVVEDRTMKALKDMLVGTYKGYLKNNKKDSLDVLIKLSYMLGKEVGKEEVKKTWKSQNI